MGIKIIKENNNFDIVITRNLEDIRILRNTIESWLSDMKVDDFKIMSVNICLMEAVYNGMLHSYEGVSNQKKNLDIKINKFKNSIKMVIKDHGKKEWFEKYKVPQLRNNTDPPTHGMGLILMENLSDNMKITSSKYGTKVIMKINVE